jgi:hypothetical protein
LDDIHAFAESRLAQIYVVAGRLHDAIETGERALSSFEARGHFFMPSISALRTVLT